MKRVSVVAIATAVVLIAASVAYAAGVTKPKLSFTKSKASIGWSSDGSSPGGGVSNANNQSIKIAAQSNGGASAYTYGPDENLVGIRGETLAQITHLGFDSKGAMTPGSPRISLGTQGDDGAHTYFLSAYHCNTATSGGWRTSDFVNGANCLVFRDGEVAGLTWAQAVAVAGANNETVATTPSDWFLVVDEGPSIQYIDRLSVEDWCWTGNGTSGIVNKDSGDCI